MPLAYIKFENFTAFSFLELSLSPGINVFVGTNGTGKTHLIKAAYAACDISKTKDNFADKLIRTFLPSGRMLRRLVKRQQGSSRASLELRREEEQPGDPLRIKISFTNHTENPKSAQTEGVQKWIEYPIEAVYIPVKEMLSAAPGFRSLYAQREIHFEEIYSDLLDRAYRPPLRGPIDKERRKLLEKLNTLIEGNVTIKDEEFFLRNKQGNLEFTLLAEGIRKLGLLWLLIQNGTLLRGSVLFWDEPETNLNPRLYGPLMDILLELHRMGVQIFLTTHDYVILKEIDLRRKKGDEILFHSLYREKETREIRCVSTAEFLELHPNAIAETFADLYDREIKRTLGEDTQE